MSIKISTGLPNSREGRQNPIGSVTAESIKHVAQVADDLGYYSLWPNEFIVTRPDIAKRYAEPPQMFDPIVTMSYAAAVTKRIRFTPSTIVLPFHEPIILGRELATLDVFSGGRMSLGIGLGGEAEEFRSLHGELEKPNRGKMMDEYVQALRAIWEQPRSTFAGKYVHFENVEINPKPVQKPFPIYMAGHAEGVLRRIAAHGQGWIDSSQTPDEIRETVAKIRGYAREVGRSDEIPVARQLYVSIADTEEAARANVEASLPPPTRPQTEQAAPARLASNRSLIGTPDQVRAGLQPYADAGATELCAIF